MKFATVASLALVAAVSAQSTVDPSKLGTGWCATVTEDACKGTIVPKVCGANATNVSSCEAVFSMDNVCMSFKTSCTCTPETGGEVKDLSFEAFNETFTIMPYNMCGNLQWSKNATHPGIVSGDYKPDGKRPNATAASPKPTGSAAASASPKPIGSAASATPTPTGGKSAGSTIQIAVSTMALAAMSLGLAMI
ncbi:hypothetical protein BG006_011279 [Podila minutissima]|uniref:Uncharacterized protein n=1 Tax=Podila minutissima TaxID=64525 RepID=A0A9P5SEQ4_9FUNG|nr:hypothetical protein BG006_011279 [Podila minutissima]